MHRSQKPPIASLYWEDAPDSPLLAVSQELYDKCTIKTITAVLFRAQEGTLRMIARKIKATSPSGFAKVEWHKTPWTEASLLKEGFVKEARPTIVAVAYVAGRFAIQYIYWPMPQQELEPMRFLGALVFDGSDKLLKTNIKGQCVVRERGTKAMNSGSTMLMYGSHAFRGRGEQHHLQAVYEPSGRVDPQVNVAVVR